MKKLFAFLAVLSLVTASTAFVRPVKHTLPGTFRKTTYVYICTGPYARVYHSSQSCSGLNNCKSDIVKISLSDAVNKYNRRACKKCE